MKYCHLLETEDQREKRMKHFCFPQPSFFFFFLFALHPWHVEFPGPGLESKPQLWSTLQLWQCQILNWLCWAGDGIEDGTCAATETSWIINPLHHLGNSPNSHFCPRQKGKVRIPLSRAVVLKIGFPSKPAHYPGPGESVTLGAAPTGWIWTCPPGDPDSGTLS